MTARSAVIALALALPSAGWAQSFSACTKTEQGQFLAAHARAIQMTIDATQAIGPNRAFERWFGPYAPKYGDRVRRNLKAIAAALQDPDLEAVCANTGQGLCDGETFAFVDRDIPQTIHLCPPFFEMETFKQLTPSALVDGHGTRAGTLIHEISHFDEVAATEDHCYARDICSTMTRNRPADALANADNYQYFVEDVRFYDLAE